MLFMSCKTDVCMSEFQQLTFNRLYNEKISDIESCGIDIGIRGREGAGGGAMSLKASVSRATMCTPTRLLISHQSAAIGPSVSLSTLRLSRIG